MSIISEFFGYDIFTQITNFSTDQWLYCTSHLPFSLIFHSFFLSFAHPPWENSLEPTVLFLTLYILPPSFTDGCWQNHRGCSIFLYHHHHQQAIARAEWTSEWITKSSGFQVAEFLPAMKGGSYRDTVLLPYANESAANMNDLNMLMDWWTQLNVMLSKGKRD